MLFPVCLIIVGVIGIIIAGRPPSYFFLLFAEIPTFSYFLMPECLQVFGDQYLKYACLYGVAVRGGLLLGCVFARSKEAAFNTVKILLFCNPTVGLCI